MTDSFDLEKFEKFLVKGITEDANVLNSISEYIGNPSVIFYNPSLGQLVEFYLQFFASHGKLPTKTEVELYSSQDLSQGFSLIKDIDYKSLGADLFFNSTERFLKERAIAQAIRESYLDLKDGKASTTEIARRFEKICAISFDNDGGTDLYKDIHKVIKGILDKQKVISTGYPEIDAYIDGGLYADGRSMYIFMAPPNKGKSLFLGNIACNIANQGKTVLVISLEMSEIAYGARFCAQQACIPFAKLAENTDLIEERMKDLPGKIIIKEFPPATKSVAFIKGWIKKNIVDKGIKLDAIVIDYLNLIAGVGDGLYEKIKGICEEVRALSYVFQASVISATQTNRSASGKEAAGLTAISESSGTAQTSDVIMEIFQNDEDHVTNVYRVNLAKNRYGTVNVTVPLKIDYNTLRITSMVAPSENEEAWMEYSPNSTALADALAAIDLSSKL